MARVIIHGCGGAGISISAKKLKELKDVPYINVDVKYIDTSRADFDEYDLNKDDFFLIKNSKVNKDIDGSGGVRSTNDEHITAGVEEYLKQLKFDRDDIHIIVSSASGGSGSLIAPRLINLLKQMNSPVVYCTLTDYSSSMYTKSTVATLKHIDLMGSKFKYTIPTTIIDNSKSMEIVDSVVYARVKSICVLVSAEHKSLDSKDIMMFIQNSYVSNEDVNGLVYLSILVKDKFQSLKNSEITSLRVLTDDPNFKLDTTNFDNKPHQYKIGYISEEVKDSLSVVSLSCPIYFALTVDGADEFLAGALNESKSVKAITSKKKLFEDEDLDGVSL